MRLPDWTGFDLSRDDMELLRWVPEDEFSIDELVGVWGQWAHEAALGAAWVDVELWSAFDTRSDLDDRLRAFPLGRARDAIIALLDELDRRFRDATVVALAPQPGERSDHWWRLRVPIGNRQRLRLELAPNGPVQDDPDTARELTERETMRPMMAAGHATQDMNTAVRGTGKDAVKWCAVIAAATGDAQPVVALPCSDSNRRDLHVRLDRQSGAVEIFIYGYGFSSDDVLELGGAQLASLIASGSREIRVNASGLADERAAGDEAAQDEPDGV